MNWKKWDGYLVFSLFLQSHLNQIISTSLSFLLYWLRIWMDYRLYFVASNDHVTKFIKSHLCFDKIKWSFFQTSFWSILIRFWQSMMVGWRVKQKGKWVQKSWLWTLITSKSSHNHNQTKQNPKVKIKVKKVNWWKLVPGSYYFNTYW